MLLHFVDLYLVVVKDFSLLLLWWLWKAWICLEVCYCYRLKYAMELYKERLLKALLVSYHPESQVYSGVV